MESLTARYRELIARAEALLVDMEKGLSRATSDRRRSPHHPGDRPGPYRTWAGSAGPHG
ncbi:MAG TPA: hypothetical protein VFH45_02440 [Acidimicrobiales bacterium]|nr:hypothetical protein [Acidimicrobiales bacterium]